MFQIIGIVVLFGCVFGSFIMSGGNIAVVLETTLPFEMLTIGGAATTAALLTANSLPVLKGLGGGMGKVFKGAKWKATDYRDLLSSLLFLLTKTMKSKGVIALESHIEDAQGELDLLALSADPARPFRRRLHLRHPADDDHEPGRPAPGRRTRWKISSKSTTTRRWRRRTP